MTMLREKVLDYLKDLTNTKIQELKSLINSEEIDVLEIIDILEDLESEERTIVFRLLNKGRALEVFEHLDIEFQQSLLDSFTEEKTLSLISRMEPDDRVRLLDELPAKVAKSLVGKLSPTERQKTAALMGYRTETAGRIMTPKYVSLKSSLQASEALERLRVKGKDKETIYTLYVTDNQRKLIGVLSLRELITSDNDSLIEDIMTENPLKVSTDDDREEVAKILQDADLLSIPVVDKEERLVGIVTIDDAVDILEEETTEDIFDKAGIVSLNQQQTVRSGRLVSGSFFDAWKVRLPFLIITLVGGMLAGVVIDTFEETLEAIAAVAIFIPVVMDMGGNVGTQSSTIFTRALILGQINPERFYKHWFKEILVGLTMGAVLGVSAGFIAHYWQGIDGLGLVVAFSLLLTITIATAVGFFIPFILYRLGFDQAAGSDPIITTIKDISGLTIYFLLVNHFLGYLL